VAQQEVRRSEEILAEATVTLACLDHANWRPARIPAPLAVRMENDA
jgi:acyl-CoA thioesterase FadM